MRYDKTGTGWGRGNAIWACDAKHSNCPNTHSPFIGMMRAEGVPTRPRSVSPPDNTDRGVIDSYHCWGESIRTRLAGFQSTSRGRGRRTSSAVTSSAAIDSNRLQFSIGRDITLVPKQDTLHLNCFVLSLPRGFDGKHCDAIEKQFIIKDVIPSPKEAGSKAGGGLFSP